MKFQLAGDYYDGEIIGGGIMCKKIITVIMHGETGYREVNVE